MKKRFVEIDEGLDFSIKHIESGEIFYDCESVVDILNELADENEQLKQENKGIQGKVWKLLELLEKEKGIDKRKIIDWWNSDVE